ncbi:putative N-acetyltransferase YjaB [invertebrate metagenome]|uniref:Putative N-acetyltransferase YjaB n=1 Tax=invertebrate metagenome TaxID=1711999 RepID=A0A2H9T9D1_9ZZZZ
MLFVAPEHFGNGIGKKLLQYVINELDVEKVDVNEQNLHARKFYEHMGFHFISRSPVDSCGKPYPILHMELN